MQIIKRGCGELLVEEELAEKIRAGQPLRVAHTTGGVEGIVGSGHAGQVERKTFTPDERRQIRIGKPAALMARRVKRVDSAPRVLAQRVEQRCPLLIHAAAH